MAELVLSEPGSLQEEFLAFYDEAPCGYLTLRRDGTILGANRTLLHWAGAQAGPRRGLHLRDLLSPASWICFSMQCVPVLAMHRRITEIALDIRREGQAPLPVLASFQAEAVGSEDDGDTRIRGILFDATERRLYERELLAARRAADAARHTAEQASARLSTVLESTTDGVLLVGPDWRIAYANPRAAALLPGIVAGEDLREVFPIDPDGIFRAAFGQAMEGALQDGVEGLVAANTWLWVHAYPAPGGGMAVFFRDTTGDRRLTEERRRHAEHIDHLASHDTLTGLPNRRLFAAKLREALASGASGMAVMCLDLDRFKQVNDRLGHPAGDALLKLVSKRLQTELRAGDTVARFGGDEFAILLAAERRNGGAQEEVEAEEVAARLVRRLSAPYAIEGERAEIGASIGITFARPPAGDPDALLAEADLALYQAKRAGRGRHAVFRPVMMSAHRARLELGDALRLGLERGELLVHYQPVVAVGTGTLRGHEALARWTRPGHGPVSPGSFIPLAEEAGLIVPLGAYILDRACRDAAAWPDLALRVAVNLSPLQFRDPGLVGMVAAALRRSGLAPARLELEITEGVLLERTEEVLATMHRLRALGVGFALDDFGTGFSSLSYLSSFPFDRVKIDRSFLREAETSDRDAAIIESVALLCRRLGMTCLAEGVEAEGQLELLARVGCGEAQGFLLGRPMPQAEVLRAAKR
ncbi:putative bifunctional diguanylate cyclase/phosphodiesterase [Paracraurococcus ruber]|uniref:Diguanylate cyclase n=1 Tax=Paracraurococcus ruber TaxID=77675 RepID=A0ABS1D4J4_9PROT|nr:EAL domain-containing protein [Paracraurococcus ruber]MBK1661386.1 hypothetical protein [Paracraurococcus ruber]TDG28915.1 EAL domain-containing protein [Paracraurococcus ruber]